MKALFLVVGLYRAPYAWEQTRNLIIKGNSLIHWKTYLVIDKNPYCNHYKYNFVLTNASSFLDRLRQAYNLINWSNYKFSVITRPDVALSGPINVNKICIAEKTTYIISGSFTRRYIFHDRDWDFGYIACNVKLFSVVTINNLTQTHLPPLPPDFRGCWGNTCTKNWRYPYMENVILRHNETGVTLRNLDSSRTFFHLKRNNVCM